MSTKQFIKDDLDYEKDSEINENDVIGEWLRQTALHRKYVKLAAAYRTNAVQLKENLEVIRAEVSLQLRETKIRKGEKFTEASINAEIITDPLYKNAMKEYLEAEEEASIMRGAVTSMEHRKAALQELSKWKFGEYNAEPRVSQQVKSQAASSASKKQKDKLNDKRRKRNA